MIDDKSKFLNVTLDMLETADQTLEAIADETRIPYDWLRDLADEKIEDPGILRLEKLHRYLYGAHVEAAWAERRLRGVEKVIREELTPIERYPFLAEPVLTDPKGPQRTPLKWLF